MRDSGQRKLTYSSQNHCTSTLRSGRRKTIVSQTMCAPAERLSQSEIVLPLRKTCYYSPLAEVGVFSTEINSKNSGLCCKVHYFSYYFLSLFTDFICFNDKPYASALSFLQSGKTLISAIRLFQCTNLCQNVLQIISQICTNLDIFPHRQIRNQIVHLKHISQMTSAVIRQLSFRFLFKISFTVNLNLSLYFL